MGYISHFIKLAFAYLLIRTVFYDLIFMYTTTPTQESIRGKRVLVTGASMGIGEQATLHYCKLGAELIITARSEDRLKNIQTKCSDFGNKNVFIVTGDMGKSQDVKKVADFVLNKFDNAIDHVVLNHVGPYRIAYFEGDINFTRSLLQINYVSYLELTTYLLPALHKRAGALVIISSITGRFSAALNTHYTGSKFAVEGFFSSLRVELQLRKSNVSLTLIPFGVIATDNALNALKRANIKPSDAASTEQAGWVVLQAAVGRPTDLFYPWPMRSIIFMRDWAEPALRKLFISLFDYTLANEDTNSLLL